MTLIEFTLLKGDYAKNEAGEQFFSHRDWRLTPERVVAIYVLLARSAIEGLA